MPKWQPRNRRTEITRQKPKPHWLLELLFPSGLEWCVMRGLVIGIGRVYAACVGLVARWRYHQIMVRRVRRIGRK